MKKLGKFIGSRINESFPPTLRLSKEGKLYVYIPFTVEVENENEIVAVNATTSFNIDPTLVGDRAAKYEGKTLTELVEIFPTLETNLVEFTNKIENSNWLDDKIYSKKTNGALNYFQKGTTPEGKEYEILRIRLTTNYQLKLKLF